MTSSTAGHTRKRRTQIIKELSDLSRNGWANARPCDYEPLERELTAIDLANVEAAHRLVAAKGGAA